MNTLSLPEYEQQLTKKLTLLQQQLSLFTTLPAEVFRSPLQHFRMRAEFRIWHDGDDLYHIMFDPISKQRQRVDSFPIASQIINDAMVLIMDKIKFNPLLRRNLFQLDYLSTLSGHLLISFIYHRQLDEDWLKEAKQLKQVLINSGLSVQIIGRAYKQKYLLDADYVDETLNIHGKTLYYRQVENAFSQPNAAINIKMLEWLYQKTLNSSGDLLELYCGNGNFSLALADNFKKVLATEISKSSVAVAQHNISRNAIDNVKIIRLSDLEFTAALEGERTFNRLKGIELSDYQCNTILVDPPRSGLPQNTLNLVQRYPTILYISCNPTTLCDNLNVLSKTHNIAAVAAFDQFPYTHHLECGVILHQK